MSSIMERLSIRHNNPHIPLWEGSTWVSVGDHVPSQSLSGCVSVRWAMRGCMRVGCRGDRYGGRWAGLVCFPKKKKRKAFLLEISRDVNTRAA